MGYVDFSDWFEYKYCPSIPGPEVDYNTYMGISTSDICLFVRFVLTGGKWYRAYFSDLMRFKNDITTLNTNYKWWKFWEPKYETTTGLLNFTNQDEEVRLINKTSRFGIGIGVMFYFDEIVQVKKLN